MLGHWEISRPTFNGSIVKVYKGSGLEENLFNGGGLLLSKVDTQVMTKSVLQSIYLLYESILVTILIGYLNSTIDEHPSHGVVVLKGVKG